MHPGKADVFSITTSSRETEPPAAMRGFEFRHAFGPIFRNFLLMPDLAGAGIACRVRDPEDGVGTCLVEQHRHIAGPVLLLL